MGKFKKKILYHGAHISAGMLALLMFALVFPMTSENSYAEPITLADNEAALLTTNIDVTPTIALAVKEQLDFEILPHSSGSAFNKGATTLVVNTNTDAGYNLYIHTTSEDGKLHNTREGITDTLNPMAAGVKATSESMAVNTWGYSSDGVNYQAVPTTSTKIPGSENSTTSKTYTINIGAKIDLNIAAGKYQGNVIFSTVANPIIIEKYTWDTITTMQEMTPEICKNAKSYVSASDYASRDLTDNRDSKIYRIAKLADGNCWMQENLALSLDINKPLTPDDSDVTADRTLPTTLTSISGSTDNNGRVSYGPIVAGSYGNQWFYQFNAATAGTGQNVNTNGTQATDSICPKGWKLPLGGPTNDSVSGSFAYLLKKQLTEQGKALNYVNLDASPLLFTRAGQIYNTTQNTPGSLGRYWSRVSRDSSSAYLIDYDTSQVQPSTPAYTRMHALSVRCVTVSK